MNALAKHRYNRIGWLRAAVLGANDGILTVASLVLGVAAAQPGASDLLLVGAAGLLSGTLAMAGGEYVSVRSQADAEAAELDVERAHLDADFSGEHAELAAIYRGRGLADALADEVARQLMQHDALAAHARDELGLSDTLRARPIVAALSSGVSFALGGALPLWVAWVGAGPRLFVLTASASLACLAALGGLAARAGGARVIAGAMRVALWGAFSMAASVLVGRLLGGHLAI